MCKCTQCQELYRLIACIHFDEFTEMTVCMALQGKLAQNRAVPQHNQTTFYNYSLGNLPQPGWSSKATGELLDTYISIISITIDNISSNTIYGIPHYELIAQ